jgi:carbon monoxide dehydrogenase subunit G
MFVIKAGFSDTVEVKTNIERVREFFANIQNFVELMPNLESIHTDGNGFTNWKIRAEIPFVGLKFKKLRKRRIYSNGRRLSRRKKIFFVILQNLLR